MSPPVKIAICNGIKQFDENRLRSRDWSRRFPGSAWITSLFEREETLGVEAASGDVALARVRSGEWRVGDVHVVQELCAKHGLELCRLGAVPAVLTVFESPLIDYRAHDRLKRNPGKFRHQIGPIALAEPSGTRATDWLPLRFPCFWREEISPLVPWAERRHAVLVAANKYWNERAWTRKKIQSHKDALRVIRNGIRKALSPTWRAARELQLHDLRLELVECLAEHGEIDVYGPGWDDLSNLPARWRKRLEPHRQAFLGRCDDKRDTVRRYRFGIAYEAAAVPSYIQEKVIDCYVAGIVPVFRGAPDAERLLPARSFLDAKLYDSPEAIAARMRTMGETEGVAIIAAGRDYLATAEGDLHSFEGFADWIVRLVREGSGG